MDDLGGKPTIFGNIQLQVSQDQSVRFVAIKKKREDDVTHCNHCRFRNIGSAILGGDVCSCLGERRSKHGP